MSNPCYLSVTSWAGLSPGAEHFYGHLHCDGKTAEVMRILDAAGAAKFNAKDHGATYRAGSSTGRFDSERAVLARARATWREHFPRAPRLVLDPGNRVLATAPARKARGRSK